MRLGTVIMAAVLTVKTFSASGGDPNAWLEEISGAKALEWVRAHNSRTESRLQGDSNFKSFEAKTRKILLSDDRLPVPDLQGEFVYNFWQDKDHVRGIFRRTAVESFRTEKPAWETVIDLDQLAREENENWVWHGVYHCPTTSSSLVRLSRGGTDADVVREFNLFEKQFVTDGFYLPEAKSDVSWLGPDILLVGTDYGDGSLTKSGYPRIVKRWHRGTDLDEAKQLLEGQPDDVSVGSSTFEHDGKTYSFISRSLDFYNTEYHAVDADGTLKKMPVPTHAQLEGVFAEEALFSLQKDWQRGKTIYKQGSLISVPLGSMDEAPAVVYEPGPKETLREVDISRSRIILTTLNNVRSRIYTVKKDGRTYHRETVTLPQNGTASVLSSDPSLDLFYVRYEDYLVPQTLYEASVGTDNCRLVEVKKLPPQFSVEGLEVDQWAAKSSDGTEIPYFIIKPKDLPLDGTTPTILYGYGGFQVSLTPGYAAVAGKLWLEQGHVYVVANIRGGGEFGPAWHQAALKGNRQRAFDDFQAVAKDLIARKVTSPEHLGIVGGSNGGLLMGVMFTQAPELFKAVVCQVPLLDMLRFHKLLAGHSWTGEYGNPDIEQDAASLAKFSPYHNVRTGQKYPHIFFVTSSKDDRVHPGHARKMAALLEEYGYPFDYYENIEGGHGAAANIEQRIYRTTLEYVYLTEMLTVQTADDAVP